MPNCPQPSAYSSSCSAQGREKFAAEQTLLLCYRFRSVTDEAMSVVPTHTSKPIDFVMPIGGTETACTRVGTGPPLLLIHGAEGSRKSFVQVAERLAHSFTVFSYDQRDCGETVNDELQTDLTRLAEDVHELIRELGLKQIDIFGSSFGGRVAQLVALNYPEATGKLILGSTWALDSSLLSLNPEIVRRATELRQRLPESGLELSGIFFPEPVLAARPELRARFSAAPVRTARTARRMTTVSELHTANPEAINARSLLIAGNLDILVPPSLTQMLASRIKGAQFKLLDGVGHISYVQEPEMVARTIKEFATP